MATWRANVVDFLPKPHEKSMLLLSPPGARCPAPRESEGDNGPISL